MTKLKLFARVKTLLILYSILKALKTNSIFAIFFDCASKSLKSPTKLKQPQALRDLGILWAGLTKSTDL